MAYDPNGNLIKDLDRDIVTIKYNLLNLPEIIQFKNGNQIRNLYDASGQKLSTRNVTIVYYVTQPIISCGEVYDLNDMAQDNEEIYIDFIDNVVNVEYSHFESYYEGDYYNHYDTYDLTRVYNNEGFGDWYSFSYYRKDHLGNNREVWRAPFKVGSTNYAASTIQRTQYYPSGLPWESNSGDNPSWQNKKYNGKEFVEMHGLDEYDSEARWHQPAIMRTTTIDPLAEKYYSISPYAWCGNNPVRMVDPDGRVVRFAPGVSAQFKKDYMAAGHTLKTHGSGNFMRTLEKSKTIYTIAESKNLESSFNPNNNTLIWSSNAMLLTTNCTSLSPTTVLNHELDHAAQKDQKPGQQKIDGIIKSTNYKNKEEERVITGSEQQTAKNLGEIKEGEVTRTDHGGTLYKTDSPTSTEIKDEFTKTAPKIDKRK